MVPVISFVGWHNAGKTTVLEKVVRELTERGFRIGLLKHTEKRFQLDKPGSDTARLAQAGACQVAIASQERIGFYGRVEQEPTLDEMCALFRDVDLIITEGYKQGDKPKIFVARSEISRDIPALSQLAAIVADFEVGDQNVPCFGLEETDALADFLTVLLQNGSGGCRP